MPKRIFQSPIKTAIAITGIAGVIVSLITANWDLVSSNIFPNTKIGLYDKEFWENFLVEMHGMVLELALVGILIVWLDRKRDERNLIKQHREELIDYADLEFPEANLKKISCLKRLNAANIYDIKVQNLVLGGMRLNGLKFKNTNLIGFKAPDSTLKNCTFHKIQMRSSNFSSADLRSSSFTETNIYKSVFVNSNCKGVTFENSLLERSDFTGANLQSAILKNADLREVKFHEAVLDRCTFIGAKNLEVESLAEAKSLNYIAIEDDKLQALKQLRSDMKYQKRRDSSGRP